MRILALAVLIVGIASAGGVPAAGPGALAPTEVTWHKSDAVLGEVARHLSDKSGVPVTVPPNLLKARCGATFDKAPFWQALQSSADKSGARITLSGGGRKVALEPRGGAKTVAATSGAFRVVAQQVVGRALLEQGVTFHEVYLLVHWEPRLRVFRIDTTPSIVKVEDGRDSKLKVDAGGAQVPPLDATSEMRVKVSGLTRDSGTIKTLSGSFRATAAEKLLAFTFEAPGGKLPQPQTQDGVTAELKRVEKKDDMWEVEVAATYPEGQPAFESFQGEWWLRDNRLTLKSPEGKSFVIEDYEVPAPGQTRPLTATYRFKEGAKPGLGKPTAKGWSMVYETPSPLAEVVVPFELKDIPLP